MKKINRLLQKLEIGVSTLLVIVILVILTANIVARYFFNSPIRWTEEISLLCFTWLGYLTTSYTLSNDGHVRFTAVTDKLPAGLRKWLMCLMDVIIIATFIALFPSALRNIPFLLPTPALRLPQKYPFYIVPAGYVLFIVHSAINIVLRLTGGMDEKKEE